LLKVSAKSAELTTEIKGSKTRSWHDTTVKAIVGKIAGEHGLGTAIDAQVGARRSSISTSTPKATWLS
jgi:phage protein D